MSVQIDNFFTNSFILKNEESVKYIKRLCELLMEEDSLTCGHLSSSAYCHMFPRSSGEEYSFVISMGGFVDGGPYLQHSSVRGFCLDRYSNPVEQNEDCEPIYIFEEIQKNLKEGRAGRVGGNFIIGLLHCKIGIQFFNMSSLSTFTP